MCRSLIFLRIGRMRHSCQIDGWNMMRRGKSSKRPANMSKIKIHFDKSVKCPKFWVGPTIDSPGPILFIVAITEVKFVTKSFSSREITKIDSTNSAKKVIIYMHTERMTPDSTSFPSITTCFTDFGWM